MYSVCMCVCKYVCMYVCAVYVCVCKYVCVLTKSVVQVDGAQQYREERWAREKKVRGDGCVEMCVWRCVCVCIYDL